MWLAVAGFVVLLGYWVWLSLVALRADEGPEFPADPAHGDRFTLAFPADRPTYKWRFRFDARTGTWEFLDVASAEEMRRLQEEVAELARALRLAFVPLIDATVRAVRAFDAFAAAWMRTPPPPQDPAEDLQARYLLGLYHAGRISYAEMDEALERYHQRQVTG